MKRLAEDLVDVGDFRESSGVHHAEPIDDLRHQSHVVADQDNCRVEVLPGRGGAFDDLSLNDDVERAVGSSAMMTWGRKLMAIAMQTRCFMPPLSSCGYLRATSGLSPTLASRSRTRASNAARRQGLAMVAQGVRELVAHAQ